MATMQECQHLARSVRSRRAQAKSVGLFRDVEQMRNVYGQITADAPKDSRLWGDLHDLLVSTSTMDIYEPQLRLAAMYLDICPNFMLVCFCAALHLIRSGAKQNPVGMRSLPELPEMVRAEYKDHRKMRFTGLFPSIEHAWASVGNSLLLWRYSKRSDVPMKYTARGDITSVCLAEPKPGAFPPAIQYIMVVCTTAEIVVLGVSASRHGHGLAKVSEDVRVEQQPLHRISAGNVRFTSCLAGPAGRIFLGGADGLVYELVYDATDSSRPEVLSPLGRSIWGFLPSMFGTWGSAAITQLVVDKERHTLYSLNAASGIKVFDLGSSGEVQARLVAEVSDVYTAAANTKGGKELFSGTAADRKNASIKYIAPISVAESTRVHLMAVTADGRRIYFSTYGLTKEGSYIPPGVARGRSSFAKAMLATKVNSTLIPTCNDATGTDAPFLQRPYKLEAKAVRMAMPHSRRIRAAMGGDFPRMAELEILGAQYSAGCLLLSGSTDWTVSDGFPKILMASRDPDVAPVTSITRHTAGSGLREVVMEEDVWTAGQTIAVEVAPCEPVLGSDVLSARASPGCEELSSAVWWTPTRFLIMTTKGLIELEKRRPIELLMQVLEGGVPEQLHTFFQMHGSVEAAAMCYQIVTSAPDGALTTGLGGDSGSFVGCSPRSSPLGAGGVSKLAARGAAAALDNPLLVGEARMPESSAPVAGAIPHSGCGSPHIRGDVDLNPGPSWSISHRGLCLYVSRLLSPVYEKKIAVLVGDNANGASAGEILKCGFTDQTLEVLEDRLKALGCYLETTLLKSQRKGYTVRSSATSTSPVPCRAGGCGAGGVGNISAFGYGAGVSDNAAMVINKRRRLDHAAQQQEDEMTYGIRTLLFRVAEACALLRLLSAHNLGCLALRELDAGTADMAKLANTTLRELVEDEEGRNLASQLIRGLVNEQLDAGISSSRMPISSIKALATTLQAVAPSFFRQEDRAYLLAGGMLEDAEAAPSGPERDVFIKQAVALFASMPTIVSLKLLNNKLAELKYYEGIVTLSLAVAAARDPEDRALQPELGPACGLARQQRCEAYIHIYKAMEALMHDADLCNASGATLALLAMIKTALASNDTFFVDGMYGFVIGNCTAAEGLLSLDAPGLESYLAREGGLVPAASAAESSTAAESTTTATAASAALNNSTPLGPLTRSQVAMLEMLCRMLIEKGRFLDVALVLGALGCRRCGSEADLILSLDDRVAVLQSAVIHARTAGDAALEARLDRVIRVLEFQDVIRKRLQERHDSLAADARRLCGGKGDPVGCPRATGPSVPALEASLSALDKALTELSEAPLELSALYNGYAQQFALWDISLRMIHFAGGCGGGDMDDRSAVVQRLWDNELLRVFEQCREDDPLKRIEAACDAVSTLGSSLHYDPDMLPLAHLAERLESLAAGLPTADGRSTAAEAAVLVEAANRSSELIVRALTAAAGGSTAAVWKVYKPLVYREQGHTVPATPMDSYRTNAAVRRVKVQLLRSAAAACMAAILDVQRAARAPGIAGDAAVALRSQAGSLACAADRLSIEVLAYRDPGCEAIARRLDAASTQAEEVLFPTRGQPSELWPVVSGSSRGIWIRQMHR